MFWTSIQPRPRVFINDAAQSLIAPALTFVALVVADNGGNTQINSAGAHGLTAPNAVGYDLYVSWAGGAGADGFYTVLSVDDADSVTIDLPFDAGLGVPTVALINTKVEVGRLTLPARALASAGAYYECVAHWMRNTTSTSAVFHVATSAGDFLLHGPTAANAIEITILQHGFTAGSSGAQKRLSVGNTAIGGNAISSGLPMNVPDINAETDIIFSITPLIADCYAMYERSIFRVTPP